MQDGLATTVAFWFVLSSQHRSWVWCLALAGELVADEEKPAEKPQADADIDPEGTPPGYNRNPPKPTYFLWREGNVWHLRTKSKEERHRFSGSIRIQGGSVKASNFEGLERRNKKRRKAADIARVNDRNNQIDFSFATEKREDGFDFTVSPTAANVTFDLKLDGYEHEWPLQIGSKGAKPEKIPFTLPAQPSKKKAAEKEKQ